MGGCHASSRARQSIINSIKTSASTARATTIKIYRTCVITTHRNHITRASSPSSPSSSKRAQKNLREMAIEKAIDEFVSAVKKRIFDAVYDKGNVIDEERARGRCHQCPETDVL